jgi:hypothetical protein
MQFCWLFFTCTALSCATATTAPAVVPPSSSKVPNASSGSAVPTPMAVPRTAGLEVDDRVEMPSLRRASLTRPSVTSPSTSHLPPVFEDASGRELLGSGRLTVSLVSQGSAPALVKIRREGASITLASVLVSPGGSRDIHLDGGAYQMLVRMPLQGTTHYFKGSSFALPLNVDGTVVLTFTPAVVSGAGSSLQEISAAEFEH